MAEAEYSDVRVEESLRVKIGEVKNLPASSFSGNSRNTCCAIKIDSEEIYRTSTVEKSQDPFFGAEFQGEIPKKFRYLSFYVYEVGNKSKVLGKVSLKKEELYKYHQKDHWFPLTYQDGDTEVQGKVQVEVKLDEYLTPSSDTSHRMAVRVLECSDLTVINGSCNPYAVVTLSYGKSKTKEVKKTAVKKKTICPQFDEKFFFYIDKGQNPEKSLYVFEDFQAGELSVSVFHDDSKVSREVLGNIFKGSFLGEVKIPISDMDFSRPHKAWYCLQAKEQNRTSDQSLGSIRLRISYSADYVFPSKYYDGLRELILKSPEMKPFTSSAAFILGEIVDNRESAAQPLVKLFLHHGKLVPLIHALADWEMSNTIDPNTLFRGNSLLTKMVDELMKLMGMPYLQDTLKSFVDQVVSEGKPCEIDPSRLREGEDASGNMANLYAYVIDALNAIVNSGLVCPSFMRDVFSTLKARAILNYPDNVAVRYHAVTSFIFLRFFTAAIMGPTLFDLYSDILDMNVQRTFTLISKGISGLVNLVSSKSNNVTTKEEYMARLFEMFPKSAQADIKMFLDIISSSSGAHFKGIEAPIVLKEGFLIKRAQGRKRFGLKNFKKRFFRLTNQSLSYSKARGDRHQLFEIPITDILAVERLEEESFKMKYMFQVVHAQRALYIQASNCVEEKEWLDILMKICKSNKNRLMVYHPAAYVNNHWLCCKYPDPSMPGCKPVTGGLPITDIQADIDSDREVEKIHSLFLTGIEKLDALQEMCGSQAVWAGDPDVRVQGLGANIEDPSTCFATIAEIQRCIITLEQEHIQYMRSVQRKTVIGSIDTPIGDESGADLLRNMNRSSERLSRHGSRSSNASNISRRSARGCRSRGGSFRERDKGKMEGEGVRKSLSGDVAASSRSLGVDFRAEVKKAASYDVMAVDSCEGGATGRKRTISTDSEREHTSTVDTSGRGDYSLLSDGSMATDGENKRASDDSILSTGDSTDDNLSPRATVPKRSTGFVPSEISHRYLHPRDSLDVTYGGFGTSWESSSITTRGNTSGLSDPNPDLNVSSSSSQNVGVLETSLEGNDIVTTTTTTLADFEDSHHQSPAVFCHKINAALRNYEQEVVDDEMPDHSEQNPHSPSQLDHSEGSLNHTNNHHNSISHTDQNSIPKNQNSSLHAEAKSEHSAHSIESDVPEPHSEGHQQGLHDSNTTEEALVNSSTAQGPVSITSTETSMPNPAQSERDSKSDPNDGAITNSEQRAISSSYSTTPQPSRDLETSIKEEAVDVSTDKPPSTDNVDSPSYPQISGTEPHQPQDSHNSVNIVAGATVSEPPATHLNNGSISGQQTNGAIAQQSDTVKYSFPELTSSCKSRVHYTEQQVTSGVDRSSFSTPELPSPVDIASVEILLTSHESDSSQEKS